MGGDVAPPFVNGVREVVKAACLFLLMEKGEEGGGRGEGRGRKGEERWK